MSLAGKRNIAEWASRELIVTIRPTQSIGFTRSLPHRNECNNHTVDKAVGLASLPFQLSLEFVGIALPADCQSPVFEGAAPQAQDDEWRSAFLGKLADQAVDVQPVAPRLRSSKLDWRFDGASRQE